MVLKSSSYSHVEIILPYKVKCNRRLYYLSLNDYRNIAYIVSNKIKQEYKSDFAKFYAENRFHFDNIRGFKRYKFTYFAVGNNNRRFDVSNLCCVVDKFFTDSLVAVRFIEDDDYHTLPEVTYKFGGVNKDLDDKQVWVRIEKFDGDS